MACNCGANNLEYVWTDGVTTIIYRNEYVAKAKVARKGGSYTVRERGK